MPKCRIDNASVHCSQQLVFFLSLSFPFFRPCLVRGIKSGLLRALFVCPFVGSNSAVCTQEYQRNLLGIKVKLTMLHQSIAFAMDAIRRGETLLAFIDLNQVKTRQRADCLFISAIVYELQSIGNVVDCLCLNLKPLKSCGKISW